MKRTIIDYLWITAAVAILAVSVHFFMAPSGVSIGSVTGLAVIFNKLTGLSVSAITFILNGGLLIVGFIFIGREFGVKTVYTSILLPTFIWILEIVLPGRKSIMGDQFADMVALIFLISIGSAILFTRNASSGGLDIIGKLLNKYLRMDIGKAVSGAGLIVAACAIFTSDMKTVIISLIGTYLCGVIIDNFIFNIDIKRRVCIISDKKIDEIRYFILNDLSSGASIYEIIGALNYEKKSEIVTLVDKREYLKLRNFVEKIDPQAFVTVTNVSTVLYVPKTKRKIERE